MIKVWSEVHLTFVISIEDKVEEKEDTIHHIFHCD